MAGSFCLFWGNGLGWTRLAWTSKLELSASAGPAPATTRVASVAAPAAKGFHVVLMRHLLAQGNGNLESSAGTRRSSADRNLWWPRGVRRPWSRSAVERGGYTVHPCWRPSSGGGTRSA